MAESRMVLVHVAYERPRDHTFEIEIPDDIDPGDDQDTFVLDNIPIAEAFIDYWSYDGE